MDTYEWLASAFNPVKFDAHAWVAIAKAAGVRYITITVAASRRLLDVRHQGDTLQHRRLDAVRARSDEGSCRRMPSDRASNSSSTTRSSTGIIPTTGRAVARGTQPVARSRGDWNRYLDFMDAQLTELLTNYGPIGGIWFDGMWDKPDADWRLRRRTRSSIAFSRRRSSFPTITTRRARRGRTDVRAGPSGREHRGFQHQRDRNAAARDLAHDEPVVGVQHHRPEVQVGAES